MNMLETIYDYIWSERIWLPENITWRDLEPGARPGVYYAHSKHLYIPIGLAVMMIVVRFLLERYCFRPFAMMLGIKGTKRKANPLPNCSLSNGSLQHTETVLEKAYVENSNNLRHRQITGLAKQLDVTERQIERWLRLRRRQNRPTTLVKFCENAWRFFYYSHSFLFGVWVLWDKPWLWDIMYCFTDYPHHNVTSDLWWYYMLSLSFYWSLCFSQFFDVRRKDFWQMFVHHIATIALMSFSWICNLCRIGSLVLVIHDCADIFLEVDT